MTAAGSKVAILGLGSNIGDKQANVEEALERLCEPGDIVVARRSRLFRTPPWGVTDQDWFVNACATIETSLDPHALLDRCQAVERDMGRVRDIHWGPRIIDVDILDYSGIALEDPRLILPHPRIAERAFVLAPLADIAPDFMIGGRAAADVLRDTNFSGVHPLVTPP